MNLPSRRRSVLRRLGAAGLAAARGGLAVLVAACSPAALTVSVCGCDNVRRDRPVELRKYFPLESGRQWRFAWRNRRGDIWSAVRTVGGAVRFRGIQLAAVLDSVYAPAGPQTAQSGCRWDSDGLKLFYRVSAFGDSTTYEPFRMLLPPRMSLSQPVVNEFTQVLHFADRPPRSVRWRRTFKLLGREDVQHKDTIWKNCVVVDIADSALDASPSSPPRVSRWWLADGWGAVKVAEGRASAPGEAGPEATGCLVPTR